MLVILITALVVSIVWFKFYAKLDHKYLELKQQKQPRFGVTFLNEYVTYHEWYNGRLVERKPVRINYIAEHVDKASKNTTYTFWF